MSGEQNKGFDLAGLMKGVSNLNTREQIEYLPFDRIDPDPDNFYSLDGLNELADNIATVGLVHPLRVRQSGDRYVVTSGHRRRAAIRLLIDSGEDWSGGVPCIVDRGESLPEFSELKLIFSNNQRQKTSAELSREAARVEKLLCSLKKKGYVFPGRMQDHVAAAMNVRTGKLKRLHAIRSNLTPELLALYDANKISEEAAYQLQQLPKEVQVYLAGKKKVKDGSFGGLDAKVCVERCEKYLHPSCKCPNGSDCTHTLPRFYQTLTGQSFARCWGDCCLKCIRSTNECPYRCERSKKKIEKAKEKRKADERNAEEERKARLEENRAILAGKYTALDILAREKKLPADLAISIPGCQTVADLHDRASGKGISDYKALSTDVFDQYAYVKYAAETAELLDVSVDFLLGRTKEPTVNHGREEMGGEIVPRWLTGEPKRAGTYFCKVRGTLDDDDEQPRTFRFDWDGEQWYFSGKPIFKSFIVEGWWPLPEV